MTTTNLTTTLREALRQDLKDRGETQKEFLSKIGVSQQALSGWFQRGNVPEERRDAVKAVLSPNSRVVQGYTTGFLPERPTLSAKATSNALLDITTRYKQSREAMLGVIQAEIPGAQLASHISVGPYHINVDYASRSIVALVLRVDGPAGRLNMLQAHDAIMTLALGRKHDTNPATTYVLVLVVPGDWPETGPLAQRLTWEAANFNVSVYVTNSYERAGKFIVDVESAALSSQLGDADRFN